MCARAYDLDRTIKTNINFLTQSTMRNIFRSLLLSAVILSAGFAVSCTEPEPEQYQGVPEVTVAPESLVVPLAGGTTEEVHIVTPAQWVITIDTEGVTVSQSEGTGDATVTFTVPEAVAMRTIKATVTATGFLAGVELTDSKVITILQSDLALSTNIYYDNCGDAVSKVDGYWPYVDAYTGWAPKGGDGVDQSGITYTGKNASVRNSGKAWAPVDATYATDAPYAYISKADANFVINNIALKSGEKSYIFSFTVFNQYASLIASPYTPVPAVIEHGKTFKLYASVDGQNWADMPFNVSADGNWQYVVSQFSLPADAEKLHIKFTDYVADKTTALPSADYQYQAALRLDDFSLSIGGDGAVLDFNIQGGDTPSVPTDAVVATVAEFLNAVEDSTLYELTGVITKVANTTYGNFDLTDETGTVYIYGLCSPTGEQKYWAASGAKVGDTITVRTVRTSYNGTPQGKNAIFVKLVPGEGGNEPTPEPAEGAYASDVPFVCATDDSSNAVYGLAATNIGGQAATGFKLGKSKQQGKFTSAAVGVSGSKYINFYASAWKGTTATLYFRVDGGAVQSVALTANDGATGNPPYPITYAATDHYSVKLEGLTASSTIEFSTNADFALTTHSGSAPDIAPRVIVCGIKLTDEPIDGENPGGTVPEPTPGDTKTIAEILALGNGAALSGTIEGIVISNMTLNNLTSKKGLYVQDNTGALQFYLAANHEFAFGTKVRIDLTGSSLGEYNGAVQISGLALDKITTVSTGNTIEPKTVAIADFLANKYEGQYIAIEGVQVAASDLANTWVMGDAHTSINIEDAAGNKFVVFSSKYASYGAETVAQGSGTIKGIASVSKGAIQIIFAQESDFAGLTGTRFDGTTPEPTPTPDPTPDPTPGEGDFASDSEFIQTTDDSDVAAYTLGNETKVNGNTATGFKLGTSKKYGTFTSGAVNSTGDKTLSFYAFSWKGKKATLYVKVEGGGSIVGNSSFELKANDGATNNAPYTISAATSDLYTINITGLTANSKIIFSTASDFAGGSADNSGNCRAIVAGVHLK